jgi:hypothetical protein
MTIRNEIPAKVGRLAGAGHKIRRCDLITGTRNSGSTRDLGLTDLRLRTGGVRKTSGVSEKQLQAYYRVALGATA